MENKTVDSLVICPCCDSPVCYQVHEDSMIRWQCFNCGFVSNSSMMKGTDLVRAFEETLPRLMLDLKFIDKENFCWYPTVIDKISEGKYILFPDGTNANDWKWALAAAVPVTFEERERFKKPDGTYSKYKTSSSILHFDNDKFAQALDAASLI